MPSPRLDVTDIRILSVLQQEGRITKLALAERVNLSPTPCWERLRRLEDAGLIAGYHARLSLGSTVPVATVFTEITLGNHRPEDFARFEDDVAGRAEVTECWALGGGIDYLLKVVTRDIAAYERLIREMLDCDIGIARYFTYFVTKPVKMDTGLPLDVLMGPVAQA